MIARPCRKTLQNRPMSPWIPSPGSIEGLRSGPGLQETLPRVRPTRVGGPRVRRLKVQHVGLSPHAGGAQGSQICATKKRAMSAPHARGLEGQIWIFLDVRLTRPGNAGLQGVHPTGAGVRGE